MSLTDAASKDRLITETEAADLLCLSPRTLRNWRVLGRGPECISISPRCVRYRLSSVLDWAEERTCKSTSDTA